MHNNKIITHLLNNTISGDELALEKILPMVYNELRTISSKYLREEYRKYTLQTTELVY